MKRRLPRRRRLAAHEIPPLVSKLIDADLHWGPFLADLTISSVTVAKNRQSVSIWVAGTTPSGMRLTYHLRTGPNSRSGVAIRAIVRRPSSERVAA